MAAGRAGQGRPGQAAPRGAAPAGRQVTAAPAARRRRRAEGRRAGPHPFLRGARAAVGTGQSPGRRRSERRRPRWGRCGMGWCGVWCHPAAALPRGGCRSAAGCWPAGCPGAGPGRSVSAVGAQAGPRSRTAARGEGEAPAAPPLAGRSARERDQRRLPAALAGEGPAELRPASGHGCRSVRAVCGVCVWG